MSTLAAPEQPIHSGSLSPAEWAVLGLLCISPAHGWTLARAFKEESGLGAILSVRTPLVYRAFNTLAECGLIEEERVERGVRGPNRTVFRATGAGQLRFRRWLREPVERAHDVHSLIVLKVVLAEWTAITPPPIVNAQKKALAAEIESLEAEPLGNSDVKWMVRNFRVESARAALRFVESLADESRPRAGTPGPFEERAPEGSATLPFPERASRAPVTVPTR